MTDTIARDPDGSANDSADVRLLRALDRAGLRWVLLRGGEGDGRAGRDLDLLVERSDLADAVEALSAVGFKGLPAVEPGVRSLILRDPETDRWHLVDLTTRFAFGAVPKLRLPVEDDVLARRERSEDAPRVATKDRFWLLLLHAVLDHDRFDDRHRRELAVAATSSSIDDPIAVALDRIARPPLAARLRAHAVAGEWDAASDAVRRLHARIGGVGTPVRRSAARWKRIVRRLPIAMRRPGMTVAIIGPDGAGKSTLVRDVPDRLPVPTQTRYLGLFGASHSPARVRGLGFLRRLTRLWAGVVTDSVALARGRVVLYDRYPYDMLRARGPEGAGRRIRRWIEAHAAPPPDLVILLEAPPELLHERRPEHSVHELSELVQHYRAIVARLDDVEIVDAAAPAADVRRAVIDAIWRRYAARLGRV